jgi:FixJ family two-component response regulator
MMQRCGYVAIVDDDASMRQALGRLLRIQGINSRIYPSARAFLEGLPAGMPDCLIVDVNMPEMSGIELQRELLNRGVFIPTIVITGNDDKSIEASAGSLGAAAFFVKPVPPSALMAAINSAKERRCNRTLDDFDKSGVVIAWLDACRSGQLSTLLNLYEERATFRCDCEGVDLAGRNSLAIYWKSKLKSKAASAFRFDDVIQIGDETQVRCQSCKGKPVRVHFSFSPSGKSLHTRFCPLPHS